MTGTSKCEQASVVDRYLLYNLSNFWQQMIVPLPLPIRIPCTLSREKHWPHPCPCWKRSNETPILFNRFFVVIDSEPLHLELSNLLKIQPPSLEGQNSVFASSGGVSSLSFTTSATGGGNSLSNRVSPSWMTVNICRSTTNPVSPKSE
jgi:hypothetical protein